MGLHGNSQLPGPRPRGTPPAARCLLQVSHIPRDRGCWDPSNAGAQLNGRGLGTQQDAAAASSRCQPWAGLDGDPDEPGTSGDERLPQRERFRRSAKLSRRIPLRGTLICENMEL